MLRLIEINEEGVFPVPLKTERIRTGYVAGVRDERSTVQSKGVIYVLVTRYFPRYEDKKNFHLWLKQLAPSKDLLSWYKEQQDGAGGRVTDAIWAHYEAKYRNEMWKRASKEMVAVLLLAQYNTVCLVCLEKDDSRCHRTILHDMLREIADENNQELK